MCSESGHGMVPCQEVAKHPAWTSGLALGDQIAALRKEHVQKLSIRNIAAAVQEKFGNCATVIPNPQTMEPYQKPLKQLDSSSYRVFSFTASVNSAASSSCAGSRENFLTDWIMVGCFCKRPIVQIFMLFDATHGRLKVKLEDGKADIVTSHQLFSQYCVQLQRFFSADSIRKNLLVEVEAFEYDTWLSFSAHFEGRNTDPKKTKQVSIECRVSSFCALQAKEVQEEGPPDARSHVTRIVSPHPCFELSLGPGRSPDMHAEGQVVKRKEKANAAAKAGQGPVLPFGLSFPQAAPKKRAPRAKRKATDEENMKPLEKKPRLPRLVLFEGVEVGATEDEEQMQDAEPGREPEAEAEEPAEGELTAVPTSSQLEGKPGATQVPEQGGIDPDRDPDVAPIILGPVAEREMAHLKKEQPSDNVAEEHVGKGLGTSKASSGGAFFNRDAELGIQSMAVALRRGMKCYHCTGPIEKGSLRFTYAFHIKKPSRSIHTTCLAQIPETLKAQSLDKLEFLRGDTSEGLSEESKGHLDDAIVALKKMLPSR